MTNLVSRLEDMSSNGLLRLCAEDDGDICLTIIDEQGRQASIQFCSVGSGGGGGGGGSPETIRALRLLFHAMSKDNADPRRLGRQGEFMGDAKRYAHLQREDCKDEAPVFCDECGVRIPPDTLGGIALWHQETCSLHPQNVR